MAVRSVPGGKSRIDVVYIATGWGEKGEAYVKHLADKGIVDTLSGLEDKMNYYVANGVMKRNVIEKAACHIKGHIAGK
jgi:lysine/ornithine N-monooxygenase